VSNLWEVLCVVCISVGSPPYPQMSRSAGDIRYTHERLTDGQHLLRLSTTDLILDSQDWRERRMFSFASDFADRACRGAFTFGEAVRESWPVRPMYSRQHLFRCVSSR
jgi:hypothetical protein